MGDCHSASWRIAVTSFGYPRITSTNYFHELPPRISRINTNYLHELLPRITSTNYLHEFHELTRIISTDYFHEFHELTRIISTNYLHSLSYQLTRPVPLKRGIRPIRSRSFCELGSVCLYYFSLLSLLKQ